MSTETKTLPFMKECKTTRGDVCPKCGSNNHDTFDTNYVGEFFHVSVSCNQCASSWIETYKFVAIEAITT